LASHTQRPPWHTKLAWQVVPQAPQLVAVVCKLVSQPLAAFASQLPKPALHVDTWQLPELQLAAALARLHGLPHWPQCSAEFSRSSQPSAALPLQLPKPLLQPLRLQVPVSHALVAFMYEQLTPQAPQLVSV
jgi:hypothetical protein